MLHKPGSLPVLALSLLASPLAAQNLLALTSDNRLVPLHAGSSLVVGPAIAITGLQAGESVLGIDFRPANGRLYGLGSTNRVYTIDTGTGAATAVGAPFLAALAGSELGFDFNPTVDRIRVVGDAGQNLRLHPDTGALVANDLALQFAATDVNAGFSPQVGASAYTNSVAGALTTTLYGIDANRDVLVTQVPPNNGTLNTVGSLGRNVTSVAGFDITPSGLGYAALNTQGGTNGTTQLFTVDLATGGTTFAGTIPNANPGSRVRGLAAVPPRPDVEIVALTTDNRLARFDIQAPWLSPAIATISGMQPGEALLAIDFRPATGQLYGLGSTSRLYTIDSTSGAATAIGAGLGSPLLGTHFGFDFNPTVDRIRIVSDGDQNLRAHPDTGAIAATDLMLGYAGTDSGAGSNPEVAGAAYTNDLPGATSTTLYVLDTARDALAIQNPPNNGTLNTVGFLPIDVTGVGGFDIGSDGRAFAALQDATGSKLYRVDLTNGGLQTLADLGLAVGAGIRGLAVRPAPGAAAYGSATVGCTGAPLLGVAGTPFAGSPLFSLVGHRAAPNAPGFFILAVNGLATPMDFGGVMAWIDPTTVVSSVLRFTDAQGTAELVMPLSGAWFGLNLFFQWVSADACGPLSLATSAGLRVTIQ